MEYLLDTNICIYIIKKKPENVLKHFSILAPGSVGISTITFAELRYGVYKSSNPARNLKALNQFILPIEILDFNVDAVIAYSEIRAYLERKGTPIGPLDTLIGSHAKSLQVRLVTNNENEFKRIPGLEIENWL